MEKVPMLAEGYEKLTTDLKALRAERPKIVDGEIALIFNTTEGWQSHKDSQSIRASALEKKVPYYTTAAASVAAARAITSVKASELEVRSLQDYYS